jgi:hypothetical protein
MSYASRPGSGFLVVSAVALAAVAFFVWGASTPDLEHVWRLQVQLESSAEKALSAQERTLLQDTLVRHPSLADSILDGAPADLISVHDNGLVQGRYAYVVRRSPEPRLLLTVMSARAHDKDLVVKVRAGDHEHEASARRDQAFAWELPATGPFPQLIEIEMELGDEPQKKQDRVRSAALVRLEPLP